MSKATVDFKKFLSNKAVPEDLRKELKIVEGILNLTPSEKVNGEWVGSRTNISVMKYLDITVRKISEMVSQGLSYNNNDYYIYVQFGGKPSVTKSPNGMIKAMAKLASTQGYIANINVGCVFEGYKHLKVKRTGMIDKIQLENSPESEIRNVGIIAPYAVVTLMTRDGKVISSKVTIMRENEFHTARNQGSGTHKSYPVPMAQKMALRRAADEMTASLGLDDSVDAEELRREISDHDKDYDLSAKPEIIDQPDTLEDENSESETVDINKL